MSRATATAPTFVEQYLDGAAALSDISEFVERWHGGADPRPLHECLGLTQEEYALWVEHPEALRLIMQARRHGMVISKPPARFAVRSTFRKARPRKRAMAG